MGWVQELEARVLEVFPDTRQASADDVVAARKEAEREEMVRQAQRTFALSCEQDARTRRLTGTPTYYGRDGGPIWDMREWGQLHSDPDYKRVASDTVGSYWVSTVWLGFDHDWSWRGDGANPRPIIFETMVFYEDDDGEMHPELEYMQERYVTEDEARAGHEEIVTTVRATVMTEAELLGGEQEERTHGD